MAGEAGGRCAAAVAALIMLGMASPLHAAAETEAPQIANYRIAATYTPEERRLTGREMLTWQNRSHESAADLYFHLYLNAFANSRSSFMRESGNEWVDWQERHPHPWGYITVTRIRIGDAEVTSHVQFVHPDDDNPDDRTVFRLALTDPVPPGASVTLEIEFTAGLPTIFARTGVAGPFAFVAQWFPKIGVYTDGAWNCHQYHATTEFFADFGVYDVALTVPRSAVVGATGVLQSAHENGDGMQTVTFHAESVHDFAWTMDPRFVVREDTVDGTAIRLLLQPNHVAQAGRYLEATRAALQYFREHIGPYPYPQLTIVDPGAGGGAAGGMEYPTLITVLGSRWMPSGVHLPEFVTVHEFGHQYWYGMVANNEFEEAWLDEGINSYFEARIMDAHFAPGSYLDLFGLHLDSVGFRRWQYLRAPRYDPITRAAWQVIDRSSYAAVSYAKTALMLDTLDGYLGNGAVDRALAAYFRRWRFRHPQGSDFIEAMNENTGQDLKWYFDQVLKRTGVLDYAVTRVTAEPLHSPAGYTLADGQVREERTPAEQTERRYRSEVVVERLGSVHMPVDLQVVFEDGTTANEHWDGVDRWKRYEYMAAQRVEWAVVDPRRTLPLDINWLNNSRMRETGTRGLVRLAARWGFWFQNLMYFLTSW